MDRISLYEIGLSSLSLPVGIDPPAEELGVIEATRNLYANRGFSVPWVCYLAVLGSKCVGTCGFTGPPKDEQVEIAYFTFPENEGKGVATKMATLLVEIALNAGIEGLQIVAHTLPTKNGSTCILERVGFKCEGEIEHEEDGKVWKWVRA
ncbi:MAG: GNAT family N-acetyltransferase [Rhodanobacteraceae bacterium]|nr:GNAT family N-acetyltransferase [Rhodanobacteraceae bacterium]